MSITRKPAEHGVTTSGEQNQRTWHVWGGATMLVVVVFVAFWFVAPMFTPTQKMENLGSAGDVAGILGTLFSGLAFAGVIVALYLQTRQIRATGDDVQLQMGILQDQAAALHGQTDALLKQVEVLYRPYVVVWVEMNLAGTRILHVMNTGRSAALRMRLSIDTDFFMLAKQEVGGKTQNLKEAYVFTNEIPSFGPNSHIEFVLAGAQQLHDGAIDQSLLPRRFTIAARYESANVVYEEMNPIDLDQFGSSCIHKDFIHKALVSIGESLEAIKEKMPNL